MSNILEITVPDIGEFKNIPVIEILVKPGDYVDKDAVLMVLESDKAALEIPSPEAGFVREVKIAIGDRVSLGSAILTLENVKDEADAQPSLVTPPLAEAPCKPPLAPIAPTMPLSARTFDSTPPSIVSDIRPRAHASPSVRRLARELGVELSEVKGSAPRSRIIKEDLMAYVKANFTAPADATTAENGAFTLTLSAWPQVDFSKFGKIERTSITKIRRISGANLARNWAMIPHVTNFEDADVTDLEAFRKRLNSEAESRDPKLTMLPFILRAAAATLAKFSHFNSSLDAGELVLKHYFHIGFAADTPNGLVVPVIKDVDTKSIRQIAAEAAHLASHARDGKLKMADMQGGCFTVSSLGGIGGTSFTPIINAPEVAILGVTRAQLRPIWNGESFQPRLILPLALSWDHRVVDGAAAARFLAYLAQLLADFRRVVL